MCPGVFSEECAKENWNLMEGGGGIERLHFSGEREVVAVLSCSRWEKGC